jgi:hypothetical protein
VVLTTPGVSRNRDGATRGWWDRRVSSVFEFSRAVLSVRAFGYVHVSLLHLVHYHIQSSSDDSSSDDSSDESIKPAKAFDGAEQARAAGSLAA